MLEHQRAPTSSVSVSVSSVIVREGSRPTDRPNRLRPRRCELTCRRAAETHPDPTRPGRQGSGGSQRGSHPPPSKGVQKRSPPRTLARESQPGSVANIELPSWRACASARAALRLRKVLSQVSHCPRRGSDLGKCLGHVPWLAVPPVPAVVYSDEGPAAVPRCSSPPGARSRAMAGTPGRRCGVRSSCDPDRSRGSNPCSRKARRGAGVHGRPPQLV
jgi:hypothetical protein